MKLQLAGRLESAHAHDGGWRATKLGTPVHQRQRRGARRQLDRPVERRITAAENHQPASVQFGRVAHLVMDLPALKGIGPRQAEAPRLE